MSRIFRENFFGAAVALDLAFHAQQPAHLDHVAFRRAVFLGQIVDDELAGQAPDLHVVAVNIGGVVGLQDVALQADHGDVRLHRLAHHGGQRGPFIRARRSADRASGE